MEESMSEKTPTLERKAHGVLTTGALPLRELLIILQTVFPALRSIPQMLERVRVVSNNPGVIEIRGDKGPGGWSKNDTSVFPIITFLESGGTLEALKVVAFWRTELARKLDISWRKDYPRYFFHHHFCKSEGQRRENFRHDKGFCQQEWH
jgi:hypothetical protein